MKLSNNMERLKKALLLFTRQLENQGDLALLYLNIWNLLRRLYRNLVRLLMVEFLYAIWQLLAPPTANYRSVTEEAFTLVVFHMKHQIWAGNIKQSFLHSK